MIARRALATLAAATTVAAVGVAIPASASGAPSRVSIVDCAGKLVTKPSTIVIECGDAGVAITNITWKTWTNNGATGKGTLTWNTCLPTTCVNGIVEKYKVKITLGGLASAPNVDIFSQVDVTFPKLGPAALETGSYTIDNKIAQ